MYPGPGPGPVPGGQYGQYWGRGRSTTGWRFVDCLHSDLHSIHPQLYISLYTLCVRHIVQFMGWECRVWSNVGSIGWWGDGMYGVVGTEKKLHEETAKKTMLFQINLLCFGPHCPIISYPHWPWCIKLPIGWLVAHNWNAPQISSRTIWTNQLFWENSLFGFS